LVLINSVTEHDTWYVQYQDDTGLDYYGFLWLICSDVCRDPLPKAWIKLPVHDIEWGQWVFVSFFLVQIDSHPSALAMMPVLLFQQIVTIIIIIIILISIQSNQSCSVYRHVKYVVSIKCNNIIIW